jgi:hypothetical protein
MDLTPPTALAAQRIGTLPKTNFEARKIAI